MKRQLRNDCIEETVEINGIRQYFLHVPSQGKPVILHLHGGPGQSQAHFAYCTRAQQAYCTFVYYDQRGAGKTQQRSKTPVGEITLENLIEDLRQTIRYVKERYQTDEVVLLGHSWGSVLGTSYILRYPNDVKGFIGVGQVVDIVKGEAIGFQRLVKAVEQKNNNRDRKALAALAGYPNELSGESFIKQMGRVRSLQSKYGATVNIPRLLKAMLKSPVFRPADLLSQLSGLALNRNLVNKMLGYSIMSVTEYQTPVCYVLGENDWQVPTVLAAEYFESIHAPMKMLYLVGDAGHMTDFDNPQGFHEAVEACLEKLCATITK